MSELSLTKLTIRGGWVMIIATTNDIAGYEVEEVFGEVFGLTVRSRNIGSQLGAGLKSILGGELKGMTKALADSREQVVQRMVEEAEAKGANAIVAMRFDTSEMGGDWTEICAYGTAVRARKRGAAAAAHRRPLSPLAAALLAAGPAAGEDRPEREHGQRAAGSDP